MMLSEPVTRLRSLGRLPALRKPDQGDQYYASFEALLHKLSSTTITSEDRATLLELLPLDGSDAYGLAWTVIHIVESLDDAPQQYRDAISHAPQPWQDVLAQRLSNWEGDAREHST